MEHNRPYYGKKVCIIIPCKFRERNLFKTLQRWFDQTYENKQIVIVDYSSSSSLFANIREVCYRYKKSLAYNEHHSDADCLILRVPDQSFFNMSHALNYAIRRTTSDIISIAGTESMPTPYYLDIACCTIDEKSFTRCIRGRLTYPRMMIDAVNGYPEFMEYWGGEDDMVVHQLQKMGNTCVDLDYCLVDNMQNAHFHEPILGYSNEESNLNKHFSDQEDDESIKYRNNKIASKWEGSVLNMRRMAYYMRHHNPIQNNFGREFGNDDPIPLGVDDDSLDENAKSIRPEMPNSRLINKRVAVILPCMNRLEHLRASLPQWIQQLYQNKQIVVVDYNSFQAVKEFVAAIAESYKLNLCDMTKSEYDYNADIVFMRIEDVQFFNISHAYNYAATRIKTDILSFMCADSCPRDYTLDAIVNVIDERSVVQIWWGLNTIQFDNWKELNGHQEFLVGWGAEDDDFIARSRLFGLDIKVLPKEFIFCIPHDSETRGKDREVKNVYESNAINATRFAGHKTKYLHVGNYAGPIGQDTPVQYRDADENLIALCYYWIEDIKDKFPPFIKQHEDTSMYYLIHDGNSEEVSEWLNFRKWRELGNLVATGKKIMLRDSNLNKMLRNVYDEMHKQIYK